MRNTDVTQVGALSMSAVPVSGANDGARVLASALVAMPVMAAPALVEHVCRQHVAKAVEVLSLKSLVVAGAAPAAEKPVLGTGMAAAGREAQLRGRVQILDQADGYADQLQRQTKDGLTGSDGTSGFTAGVSSTTSVTSNNGTNPINPWDLRTSSPPG